MVNKFNVVKKKSIVCCIVNNTNRYQSGWAREISINLSDFLVHRFIKKDYDVYIGDDEDQLLLAAQESYSHAVVVASGMSLGLSDRLFDAIDQLCCKDFFIAGHILDRNEKSYWRNGYYEMHHQFYIIRLADYKELGSPAIGQQESTMHTQLEPERSQECLYGDHEVAAWIRPGSIEKQYEMKCHGWNIISCALSAGKTIIDLGSEIRSNKKYLYYEYDHVFLRSLSDIYHDQFFCNNFFASWNSDPFESTLPIKGPIEQYITVGIGLNWAGYLERLGTVPGTRVIFTDINQSTLKFMKALVEEWDGNDYAGFYRDHLPMIPNGIRRDIDAYIEYTHWQWQDFVGRYDDWLEVWARIKKLDFDYILIDYMSTHNLDWIQPGRCTLINLSDVFTHCPYVATQSLKYRISCENKLIKTLQEIDPNINLLMSSRSADGYYPQAQIKSGPVGDFDLTDINVLNKTPWHGSDWTSNRMLG
jgi:hypothetical protein